MIQISKTSKTYQVDATPIGFNKILRLHHVVEQSNVGVFAQQCAAIGLKIVKNSLVVLEKSIFKNCSAHYVIPILEDVSGLKHGQEFTCILKNGEYIAFYDKRQRVEFTKVANSLQEPVKLFDSWNRLENTMLNLQNEAIDVSGNALVKALYEAGIRDVHAKILIQGTGLQGVFGSIRKNRLAAFAYLAELFEEVEIFDPYLEDEGDLNKIGLHLTQNFTGNYQAILQLNNTPLYEELSSSFYKSFCEQTPLFIRLNAA